ncbi:ABC transporter ATP-binding protein [Nitrincola alkalilacustris]|uniref:ABC transporter ATP-binding protein n=1 Tax=Nitrincola alkalilacustris TaxID=1571224 RepID=UPI0019817BDB|nr:ATP-binding cassette domain-containing protein [Nitrincola alkalilacustris]
MNQAIQIKELSIQIKDLSIQVKDLRIHAGEVVIVDSLSMTLKPRMPLTILGETGSGKSLLAQAIMGLLPDGLSVTGSIRLGNQELLQMDRKTLQRLWGRSITMLPQEPWHSLDPVMKARQQVAEVHEVVHGVDSASAGAAADKQLQQMGLSAAGQKIPTQLSGGMAQRLAFAAATAAGASIVIADEPTKGLDYRRRDDIVRLLQQRLEQGSVLTITHDIEVARQLGGDMIVMRKGQVVERGKASDILANPKSDYAKQLIAAAPTQWKPLPAKRKGCDSDRILSAEKISISRGGAELFKDLSLTLNRGEILGITGDSGAGKSTLGDLLLGLTRPDAGQIRYSHKIPRHQMLKLYQDPPAAFAPNVKLGTLLKELVRLHKLDESRIPPLLERLQLDPGLLQRTSDNVSGGELQRIALLRALLPNPVILFADEPTSRLDPITTQSITELLAEVAREYHCALLLVSHDPVLVDKVCDGVISL